MGGSIQAEKADYLAATFTSSIFRFVDDLEIRIDTGQKMIHVRSASRIGHGDGGVNRKRVEHLENQFWGSVFSKGDAKTDLPSFSIRPLKDAQKITISTRWSDQN